MYAICPEHLIKNVFDIGAREAICITGVAIEIKTVLIANKFPEFYFSNKSSLEAH